MVPCYFSLRDARLKLQICVLQICVCCVCDILSNWRGFQPYKLLISNPRLVFVRTVLGLRFVRDVAPELRTERSLGAHRNATWQSSLNDLKDGRNSTVLYIKISSLLVSCSQPYTIKNKFSKELFMCLSSMKPYDQKKVYLIWRKSKCVNSKWVIIWFFCDKDHYGELISGLGEGRLCKQFFFSHMLGKLFYPFVCWLRNRHLSTAIQKQMFVSRNERQKSLGDTHLNSCLNLFKCFLTT